VGTAPGGHPRHLTGPDCLPGPAPARAAGPVASLRPGSGRRPHVPARPGRGMAPEAPCGGGVPHGSSDTEAPGPRRDGTAESTAGSCTWSTPWPRCGYPGSGPDGGQYRRQRAGVLRWLGPGAHGRAARPSPARILGAVLCYQLVILHRFQTHQPLRGGLTPAGQAA
jgi:hypothetical protein